jgi:hypothetical protein
MIVQRARITVFIAAAGLVLAICCVHLSTIFTSDDIGAYLEAGAGSTESVYLQPDPDRIQPVAFLIEETRSSAEVPGSRAGSPSSSLTLGGLRIFCEGDSLSRQLSRSRVKKYRIDLAGTGFAPDSQALIDGESTDTIFTNSTHLSCNFPAARISGSGPMTVAVRNAAGQVSNVVTVQIYLD